MAVFIEIIEGEGLGSRFRVIEGLTIGRTQGDIILKDSKISAKHAYIDFDLIKKQFVLMDNNSSNGIYISQHRVKKVSLIHGVTFQLGKIGFKVVHVKDEEMPLDFKETDNWKINLKNLLPKLNIQNTEEIVKQSVFVPLVRLKFLTGIQADEIISVAYGPRTLGSDSPNLRLLDKEAPSISFILTPTSEGPRYSTPHPDLVLLNDANVESDFLKDGDIIQVGQTKLQVELK